MLVRCQFVSPARERRARMTWGHVGFWVICICLLLFGFPNLAPCDVLVSSDVLDGGGREGQSASYLMHDSFAQGPLGFRGAVGLSKEFRDGFWATLPDSVPPCLSWTVCLTVTDGILVQERCFGVHCLGTDDYDAGLDEIIPPPGFTFYSYLRGTPPFLHLSTNIKSSEPDSVGWLMSIANADSFWVSWNPDSLPSCEVLTIGGVDMHSTSQIGAQYDQTLSIVAKRIAVAVPGAEFESIPATSELLGIRPNPFNPTVHIQYQVGAIPRNVSVRIYNITGRLVKTLVNEMQDAGAYEVSWSGDDVGGSTVGSGVFLCAVEIGAERFVKKMTIVK